ncbi:Aerotolerance protein BatD [Mesoflavibacter sp. HG96]|uniref:BatD family protein n=1 Tax=Mesoflavibacter profundi TaxID=2708110 RepID=A0ABT4S2T2_9FLAO|nr:MULTISPECIES: BatD family protein [Mesoflavibacter]MDA0178060.1 BatD family protein [Mesoflavibacter profundi]QIJ89021.1 Aerotolerance protein BatD [Mesoflavibacter sp. HG96]QIJ91749.1 Aerotolerance protein BatD [Mesoflavibacter sp. HG37]
MKLLKHIFILLLALAPVFAIAQDEEAISFVAKVSKKKLGLNERLRVDFEMNKDGDNFQSPNFEGFTVVGGPNQSVSHSWFNGKRNFSKTYSYFLAPKQMGTFTINQATIEIDGTVYKTSPITIKVTKAIDIPENPNDPDYILKENIHLVAEVSKTNPYLNEPITVVYKLYVAPKAGISNFRETESPKFNGFWSQNIDIKGIRPQNGTYDGEEYRYVVLRKAVLFPQKTGKLEIEPLSLDLTIDVPTNQRDIFGRRINNQAHRTITANTRTINVKPLPQQGKPVDFTGAVGEFDFNVTATKTELNATEALQAKIEVSGKGNLKLFELPGLKTPSALEVYDPEHEENIRTNLAGMQGKISDSYTIVPQYKGKFPIPPVTFSYFDLKTETYKVLSSKDIVINVLEGPVYADADNNLPTNNNQKQAVVLNDNQFAFIKTKTNLKPIQQETFFNTTAFWMSLITPLLAIPLALLYRRKRDQRSADVVGNRLRKADRLAKKYLSEAKKALGQKEAFYIALEKALHNYLKGRLNIETTDLSKEKISLLLEQKQVDNNTIKDFLKLLENCELARYTPMTQVAMEQDYNKASSTISNIDKQIR